MALRRRLCVTAAACGAGCTPFPVWAVDHTQPAEQQAPPRSTIREGEQESTPIIVTALRRPNELQRTPVSVVSLSAADLENRSVTNLRGLQNFIPNLTFAPSQNVGDAAGNIFIRGIGQEDFLAGAEPGVGLYLDGVYVARTMGVLIDLIDVARIEVLRGPQGTLYGKNAVGGAINVISAAPEPQRKAYADVIAGDLGRFEFRGMVNAPLTDAFIVRIAGGRISRDGYLTRRSAPFQPTAFTETNLHPEGKDHGLAGRLQLRWLTSPTLTVDFAADASRRRGTQAATRVDAIDPRFGILPDVNGLIRQGRLPGPEITDALVEDDWLASHAGGPNSIAQNIEGVATTVTKELGRHSVKLTAAHRRLRSHVATDLDGTWYAILQSDFRERHRQNSAELHASGTFGRLTYSAGLFGLSEQTHTSSGRGVGRLDVRYLCGCFYPPNNRPTLASSRRDLGTNSYAAYVQSGIRITDRLSATLGGRFSHERKRMDVQLVQLDPDTFDPTKTIVATGSNHGQWNSFTWRTGMEFQARPNVMLYASAAKGYKSGGFNGRPVINLPNLGLNGFDPETALNYEAGIRSQWLDRRLRLNATVFHTSYRGIQLRQQNFVGGVLTTLIENAARARIRGLEIEVEAKFSDRLTAGFAYGHVDPQYLDVGRVPNLTLSTSFQRTPRHSFTTSLDYSLALGSNTLSLHGDYSYRSHEQFQLLPSDFDQPGYALLGARLSLRGRQDRWSAALFGTNLTDKHYRAAGRGAGLREVGFANSVVGLPRQVGVEFKAGF